MIPEDINEDTSEAEAAEAGSIEGLKQALAEARAEAESNLANWQRAQADFINYKRRSEMEREETHLFANATLMGSILPALDDLERALAAVPDKLAKLPWVDGVRLIERKLRASLEAQGLTQIKAQGEPFDPRFHEAMRHAEGPEGVVVEELQKGYTLNDRVIRPSQVVVGNGEEETKEA